MNAMPEEAVRPTPLMTGRELIAAGYTPGPAFKEMLQAVEDAQLEGAIATAEEAMALVRERFGHPGSGQLTRARCTNGLGLPKASLRG